MEEMEQTEQEREQRQKRKGRESIKIREGSTCSPKQYETRNPVTDGKTGKEQTHGD